MKGGWGEGEGWGGRDDNDPSTASWCSKLPPVFSCRLVAALGKQLSSDAELASGAAVCKRYRE